MLKGVLFVSCCPSDPDDTFVFFSCGVPNFVPSKLCFLFLGTPSLDNDDDDKEEEVVVVDFPGLLVIVFVGVIGFSEIFVIVFVVDDADFDGLLVDVFVIVVVLDGLLVIVFVAN